MIRVGVLRGGTSNEYERSLDSGAYVLRNLSRDKYHPIDIFVDKEGVWHLGGRPLSLGTLKSGVDVLWNALHGAYGEAGALQRMLEKEGIPYTGADPVASGRALDRKFTAERLAGAEIKTAQGLYVDDWGEEGPEKTIADVSRKVFEKLSPPWDVKAISRGHMNKGVRCRSRDELAAVLLEMFDHKIPVVIEEAVLGKLASVIAVPAFRGKENYTFIPTPQGASSAKFSLQESQELQAIAARAHKALDLGPYSRIEAVVSPRGRIFVTHIETMPDLHEDSDIHGALFAVGSSFDEFADHMIERAMGK